MSEEQKKEEQKTVTPKAEPKPATKEQLDALAGRVKALELQNEKILKELETIHQKSRF
jgi:hypothetical protein